MPRLLSDDTIIARGWPPFAARDDLACSPDHAPLFYQDHGGNSVDVQQARALCASCPARPACLKWALDTRQAHGMWGGATAHERGQILRDARGRAVDRLLDAQE